MRTPPVGTPPNRMIRNGGTPPNRTLKHGGTPSRSPSTVGNVDLGVILTATLEKITTKLTGTKTQNRFVVLTTNALRWYKRDDG